MKEKTIAARESHYCFVTRILPEKERRSTDEAPEFEVPAKERPSLNWNVVCCGFWNGKSLLTLPFTERAVRSTEAFAGTFTSMSPEWFVKV